MPNLHIRFERNFQPRAQALSSLEPRKRKGPGNEVANYSKKGKFAQRFQGIKIQQFL
jgi:hypothetical protein